MTKVKKDVAVAESSDDNAINAERINQLQQELASLNGQVLYLQNELDEVSSLKAHIKKFTRKKLRAVNDKIEHILQPQKTFHPVVPVKSDDLLFAAQEADIKNLAVYNQTFTENSRLRLYHKTKRLVRAILGKKANR